MHSKNDLLLYIGAAISFIILLQCIYGEINGAKVHYSIDTDIAYGEIMPLKQHCSAVVNLSNRGKYPSYGYVAVKLYNASIVNDSISITSSKYHDMFYLRYNLTEKGEYKDKRIMFEIDVGSTYSMVTISCFNDWNHDFKKDYFISFANYIGDIPVSIMFKEKDGFYKRLNEDQMRVRMNQLKDANFFYKD
jgi:hypothetical protein